MESTMQGFVTAMREKRGWSLRRLAAELGYPSTTTIVRLCQDSPSIEGAEKFARALRALRSEPLDQEELAALNLVLERIYLGDEDFRANQLLLEYLSTSYDPKPTTIRLLSVDSKERTTLLDRYRDAEDLRIVIFNCEYVDLFAELAELLRDKPETIISHYLVTDGPVYREVERLRAISPLLYSSQYLVYSRDPVEAPMGMLKSDAMTCAWRRDGHDHLDTILFLDRDQGMLHDTMDNMDRFLPSLPASGVMADFKPARLLGMDSDEDFMAYCRYCAELERDRTVMRIKPDFGIEQIPVPILADAFRGGCPDQQLVEALLPSLIDLFSDRCQNARTRRQPQYHVFQQSAMWHFMHTGKLSDHPYLLRPFTMAERAAIVRSMLDTLAENPYVHVAFFKPGETPREDEFIYYEHKGLSLVKPHTDYHLGSGHSEIMISQQRFLRVYRDFYLNSVLRYHALPESKTRSILSEMLRFAEDHPD